MAIIYVTTPAFVINIATWLLIGVTYFELLEAYTSVRTERLLTAAHTHKYLLELKARLLKNVALI
jgi:hypothetical protein